MTVYLLVAIIAVCWGTGGAMQKYGMSTSFPGLGLGTLVKDLRRIIRVLFGSRIWLGGIGLTTTGGVVFFFATSIGDISVIQPLSNLNGAVAVLIGITVLKERMGSREAAGVFLLLGGAVLLGHFTDVQTGSEFRTEMLALLTGVALVLLVAGFALFRPGSGRGGMKPGLVMALVSGIAFGLAHLYIKVATETAKGAGGTLNIDFETAVGVFSSAPIYVLLMAAVIATVCYQLACAHGRVAVIQPVTTVFSNLLPVAGGWLIFGEVMNAGKLAAIGIIILGTTLLTTGDSTGDSKVAGGSAAGPEQPGGREDTSRNLRSRES